MTDHHGHGPYHYKHGWIPIDGAPSHGHRSADTIATRAHAVEAMHRGGLPEDMHTPMLAALSHQEKYPGLVDHLQKIGVNDGRGHEEGRYTHQQLTIARDAFDPHGTFAANRQKLRAAEEAHGGNTYHVRLKSVDSGHASHGDALVAHEMGHAVEAQIGHQGRLDAFTAMAHDAHLPTPVPVMRRYDDGSIVVDAEATLKKWIARADVKKFLASNLSQYGSSNMYEAAAEAWAAYSLDGSSSPSWVRAFGDTAAAILKGRAAKQAPTPPAAKTYQSHDPVDIFRGLGG